MTGEAQHTGAFDAAVVVTTYNRTDYLPMTLDSVVAQQFNGRIEVVVVDDGSTDDTAGVVARYTERFADPAGAIVVRYVHQENQGLAIARNTGFAATTAPFIAFVDDDDICEPTKIAEQVAALRADHQVGLVHTSFRYIDAAGRFTSDAQRVDNPCVGWCVDVLLNELLVISSTVMVRRATLQRAAAAEAHGLPYDPKWVRSQDYDMALRMARLAKFAYIPTPLLRYRFHAGNIAMTRDNIQRAYRYHCNVQLDFVRRYGREIGVDDAEARRRVRNFLHERAESHFWQRKFDITKKMCELAREFEVYDDAFASLDSRAARPAWLYRAKDAVDRLLGRGAG